MSLADLDKILPVLHREISQESLTNLAKSDYPLPELLSEFWHIVGPLFIRFIDEKTLYNLLSTNYVHWNSFISDERRLKQYFFNSVNDYLQRSSNLSKFWAWQVMKSRDAYDILHACIIKLDIKTDYYEIQNATIMKDHARLFRTRNRAYTHPPPTVQGYTTTTKQPSTPPSTIEPYTDDKKDDKNNNNINDNIDNNGLINIRIGSCDEISKFGYIILYLLNHYYSKNMIHKPFEDSDHYKKKVNIFCNKFTMCEPEWGSRRKIDHFNMMDLYHFIFNPEFAKLFNKEISNILLCKDKQFQFGGKSNRIHFGMSLDNKIIKNDQKNIEPQSDYIWKGSFHIFNEWAILDYDIEQKTQYNISKNEDGIIIDNQSCDVTQWLMKLLSIHMKKLRLIMKEEEFELELMKMVRQVENWYGGWRVNIGNKKKYLKGMMDDQSNIPWLSPKYWFALILNHRKQKNKSFIHLFCVLSHQYIIALRLQL